MLKLGVLGVGHLGKFHLGILKDFSNCKLVGFYDPSEETSKEVLKEFNICRFNSIDALLDNVDVVDVVSPTVSHFNCALKALKKSKHVFIEKPVTSTVQEAKELIAIAKEADVKVQVGHVERFNPALLAARPYIVQPMFIEAHRLRQFNPRGTDVSVILDLMIHDIDIILSLIRSAVKKINVSGVSVISDTPDIANARIEFSNGCVANLTASRISLKSMRKMRIFQKDAYISIDFLKKRSEVVRIKDNDGNSDPLALTIDLGKDKGKKLISFDNLDVQESNAIKLELELFINSILNNTTPLVTLQDGFEALNVANQIIEKLKITTPVAAD